MDSDIQVTGPAGFYGNVASAGIKDASLDFMLVASELPCTAAGVFTRSRFAGSCVQVSRAHLASGSPRAVVALSKNANVATGATGYGDTLRVVGGVATALGIPNEEVVIAATGVIGRRLPMDRIDAHLATLPEHLGPVDFEAASRAIMTTDTVNKLVVEHVGDATVVGIAKGVGMIAPDMATLLAFFFTDAGVPGKDLSPSFRRVVDKTFNCLSIDTDTSTSDTALVLANGAAGPVDPGEFEQALWRAASSLVKKIARDGEGATKLLEVRVDGARDGAQAKRVARLIVDSPLVKTAVHGADPNWGRVAMAVGKASDDLDIDPERTIIRFGTMEVYPRVLGPADLGKVAELLARDEVTVHVSLQIGDGDATVWGCDLSEEYVHINADYTT